MRRINTLICGLITLCTITTAPTWACFSPTDHFAAEAVLNQPGITYDLTLLRQAIHITVDDETIVFRSHFHPDVAVVLSEQEDLILDPQHQFLGGLSVRIQIPTESVEGAEGVDLVEAIDVSKDTFDFQAAMWTELEWLATNQVVNGLMEVDLQSIVERVQVRLAGWNSRLVFSNGQWVPYFDSDGPQLLRDGANCSGFSGDQLPEGILILADPSTDTSPLGKLATIWGRLRVQ